MSDDSELKALVLKLYNRLDKIEHSPALNGGFSTLSTDVKNLMVDVKKMNDKVEKIYDPEEGLYPRITKMEISLNTIKEKLNDHKKEDEKQAELNETTKQLQMVGGSKLEKLELTEPRICFVDGMIEKPSELFNILNGAHQAKISVCQQRNCQNTHQLILKK